MNLFLFFWTNHWITWLTELLEYLRFDWYFHFWCPKCFDSSAQHFWLKSQLFFPYGPATVRIIGLFLFLISQKYPLSYWWWLTIDINVLFWKLIMSIIFSNTNAKSPYKPINFSKFSNSCYFFFIGAFDHSYALNVMLSYLVLIA